FNLTSNGWDDIFIQKLDVNGNLLWAASMGDIHSDRGSEVVIGADGNIYMTGYFWGTIDADPGDGEYFLTQNRLTTMVLKIEPDGDLIWAKQMGSGDVGHAYGFSIAVDSSQNVITSGYFYGRVDFDPGLGTYNLTCTSYDVFIQKLDANGNFIWAKQIIGTETKIAYSMATDVSGNIYASGYFKGTVDFNPDKRLKYNLTSYGDYDAFVLKLAGNGDFIWAKQIGGSEQDLSYSIALDPSGYLYATGHFYGTVDFNPGTGTYTMTSFGGNDAYVLKLDLSGNFVWAEQIGGASYDSAGDIIIDGEGNFYVSGYFYSTTDFDPGADTCYLTANGHDDSFVFKSDTDGNLLWVTQTGGPGWDYSMSLALDASGNIFNVGSFEETADFNPTGNGFMEMTNLGVRDMFVQKLNPSGGDNCPVPDGLAATNITESSADLNWNAVTDTSGYYVRYREIATEWIDSEIVNGTNLTISGLAPITAYEFQVRTGCFSNYSYSYEFLTPGGCPDNYEPNGSMATASPIPVNTYITALIGSNGDNDWFSFSTTNIAKNINITLTDLPADYNIRLYKSSGILIGSSSSTGTTPESIIYNTTKSGTYYIWVGGLTSDTYDPVNCYTLKASISSSSYRSTEADINDSDVTEELTVYPNPSNSTFNFRLQTASKELVTLQLFDISGRLVQEYQSLSPDEIITAGDNLENGVYVAVITQGTLQKFVKIAKVE
ncbi:MAG: SBBP repeat-containing protein, partial [Bacteroidales bacterium]|nr:SBBP repeat-containing protein [Bacteroidales bacterium]